MKDAFFTLHQGLDREGPGEAADVVWAANTIGLDRDARICDAGCGPGADIAALLAAAPDGRVTAIDSHKPFIEQVLVHYGEDRRVLAYAGNMAKLKGPFDLIWSAGALYFLGIAKGLKSWRPALAKSGVVAFSEPCYFSDEPSRAARDFWAEYPGVTQASGINEQVRSAGFETLATRPLSNAAWQNYYGPLQARIDALRPDADAALIAVLDQEQTEIDNFNAAGADTGYLLSIVRPA